MVENKKGILRLVCAYKLLTGDLIGNNHSCALREWAESQPKESIPIKEMNEKE